MGEHGRLGLETTHDSRALVPRVLLPPLQRGLDGSRLGPDDDLLCGGVSVEGFAELLGELHVRALDGALQPGLAFLFTGTLYLLL